MDLYLNDYLKRFKPELFNLSKFPMRRADKSVYGYEFEIGDSLVLIFEYMMEPERKGLINPQRRSDLTDEYPKLRLSRKLGDEIEAMFGPEGIELLKKWLQDYYELPVKTIDT